MNAIVSKSSKASDPWKILPVTLKRIREEASDVFSIDLALDDPAMRDLFHYEPGQFNMLYVPGVGEAAISIAGGSSSTVLQHTIRSVGSVTGTIAAARVGASLGLRGPFGSSWPVAGDLRLAAPSKIHHVVIAAGGIGIAPLRSMVKHIVAHRGHYGTVDILLGARTPDDLLYQDEFADWRSQGVGIQTTVDRASPGWNGHTGVVTLLLDRVGMSDPDTTLVLTCGPEVMMRYVAKSAGQRGVPNENIWLTLERNMNCAVGLCGHCQLGPKLICRDGPVFRYDAASPWLKVQDL